MATSSAWKIDRRADCRSMGNRAGGDKSLEEFLATAWLRPRSRRSRCRAGTGRPRQRRTHLSLNRMAEAGVTLTEPLDTWSIVEPNRESHGSRDHAKNTSPQV